MKELNIIEAMAMPVETEFMANGMKVKICTSSGLKCIKVECTNKYEEIIPTETWINAKFIPIQKPVSFMEAVKSGKKVKVDYSDIDTDDNHAFSCEDYRDLASLIFDIVNKNGSKAFKEIILNGKWYIED